MYQTNSNAIQIYLAVMHIYSAMKINKNILSLDIQSNKLFTKQLIFDEAQKMLL